MSETNAQGQSPLDEGTDRDREDPVAPNITEDPDLNPGEKPEDEEAEEELEADGPVREDPEPLDH